MKKISRFMGLALSASLALAACNKVDEPKPEVPQGEVDYAIYVASTKTVNNGTKTNWVAEDAISVFLADAGAAEYTAEGAFTITEENLAEGKFTGKITAPLADGASYDWYAVYPANDANTTPASVAVVFGPEAQTVAAGSTAGLAGVNVPLAGKGAAIASDAQVAFSMKQLATVIKVNVKNNNTKACTINSVAITAPEAIVGEFTADITDPAAATYTAVADKSSATVTATLAEAAEVAAGESVSLYIVAKPFSASTISVSVNDDAAQEVSISSAFKAGTIKEINVNAPTILDPYPDFDEVMIYSFESIQSGFTHTTGAEIVAGGQKDGAGYLSRTEGGDAEIFCCVFDDAIDLGIETFKKGHLLFWFYVKDAALLKSASQGGRIEIGHAGPPNVLQWDAQKWLVNNVQDGWNLIDLPFSAGFYDGNSEEFNTAETRFLRIWINGIAAENTYGIDALAAYEADEVYFSKIYYHNCDDTSFFNGTVSLDTENAQEGTGCVSVALAKDQVECIVIQRGANIVNAECNQTNGHLHFKLYVSDLEAFATGDGQIELSHSNTSDNQEISWSSKAMFDSCQVGWNDIDLKFSDAAGWGSGNDYNPAGTNWFRIYFVNVNKEATLKIDDIYFYAE